MNEAEKKHKFKIGDRVFICDETHVALDRIGQDAQRRHLECTVDTVDDEDDYLPYRIETPEGYHHWLSEGDIEQTIEDGDYVRIVEDAEMYDDQDLIYLRDIQAVGVMRGELNTGDGWIAVQFPRGQFAFPRNELYLADVSALLGEMEEMIAEEAAEEYTEAHEAEILANPKAVHDIIQNLRETVNDAESEIDAVKRLHDRVVETYEARLNEHKTALEKTTAERDGYLATVKSCQPVFEAYGAACREAVAKFGHMPIDFAEWLSDYVRQHFQQQYEVTEEDSEPQNRIVTIPAMDNHGDYTLHNTVTIKMLVRCPVCQAERTGFRRGLSYDGSRRIEADTWANGCGHNAFYSGARLEAQENGLNPGYTGQAGYDVRKMDSPEAIIAALRVTVDKRKPLSERVTEMYEARLNEHKQALEETFEANAKWEILHSRIGALLLPERKPSEVNVLDTLSALIAERDSLLVRNKLLEAKLRPFALAALVERASGTPETYALVGTWTEKDIPISDTEHLCVRHLNDALDALPELKPGSANAGDESA